MNSTELTPSSHVVVVNRWREQYADFARYLDHRAHRVTYVSTQVGLASIPPTATEVVVVEATDDLAEVRKAVAALAERHGAPDRIVALKEDDLLVGAALRAEWGVPGPGEEQLLPFRDKFRMASEVAAAGVEVPDFAAAPDARAVLEFAGRAGWPVIVKPLIGSSSAGVVRMDGPDDVAETAFHGEPRMVQAFNPHGIYHVDGSFDGSRVTVVRASRYLNNCLEFRGGGVLGSVEEDDPRIQRPIAAFALRVLRALTDRPTVFHLEVFFDPATRTCAFLEVGARVGGAEIPLLWREVHGRDLMETAFRNQLGLPVREEPEPESEPESDPATAAETGGWLLVPAPESRPCRITEVTPMAGPLPGQPYAEALLTPGEVLPEADSYYEHVGGRFRFRGGSTAAVEEAIRRTAAAFEVRAEPVVAA